MTKKTSSRKTLKPYRVVGYDSFSFEDFPVGEFATKSEAIAVANSKASQMTLIYVYGPHGKRLHKAGSF